MSKFVYTLPLAPYPIKFRALIRGIDYWFVTQYREADEAGWVLDILDANQQPMIMGIALVAGLDLLWQYNHLNIGFGLVVLCRDRRTTPTFESLGVEDDLVLVAEI